MIRWLRARLVSWLQNDPAWVPLVRITDAETLRVFNAPQSAPAQARPLPFDELEAVLRMSAWVLERDAAKYQEGHSAALSAVVDFYGDQLGLNALDSVRH